MPDYVIAKVVSALNSQALRSAQTVWVVTTCAPSYRPRQFDYELIKASAKLIVDSRGRYFTSANHIVKA